MKRDGKHLYAENYVILLREMKKNSAVLRHQFFPNWSVDSTILIETSVGFSMEIDKLVLNINGNTQDLENTEQLWKRIIIEDS